MRMLKKKLVTTLMASSLFLGTSCTPEILTFATDLAGEVVSNEFGKEFGDLTKEALRGLLQVFDLLESGNRLELNLVTVDDEGNETTIDTNDIESFRIAGTSYSPRDLSNNLIVDDFAFKNDVEAEAEIQLKGFESPTVVLVSPRGQSRNNIRLKGKIAYTEFQGPKVFLQDKVRTIRLEANELEEAKKTSVKLKTGPLAPKLKGKKIVVNCIDGEQLSPVDALIDEKGDLLFNISFARRILLAQKVVENENVRRNSFSLRDENYERKKRAVRQRVLARRDQFIRREVFENSLVSSRRVDFNTKQFDFQNGFKFALDVLKKLAPEKKEKVEKKENEIKNERRSEIEERRNQQRSTSGQDSDFVSGNTNIVGGRRLTRQNAAQFRGQAATKLAANGTYLPRTIYISAKPPGGGELCVFKLNITAKQLQSLATQINRRIEIAERKAKEARERLAKEAEKARKEQIDIIVEETAEEVYIEENIIEAEEDELAVELQAESISSESEDGVETASDLREVLEIIEAEEIEEELEDELAEELGGDVGNSDEFALDIDHKEVDSVEAENEDITDEVGKTRIDEDKVDLEELAKEADEEAKELDQDLEDAIATQLALEEALKEGELEQDDLVVEEDKSEDTATSEKTENEPNSSESSDSSPESTETKSDSDGSKDNSSEVKSEDSTDATQEK